MKKTPSRRPQAEDPVQKNTATIFRKPINGVLAFLVCLCLADVAAAQDGTARPTSEGKALEKATLGSGCFWCTEAVYQQLRGVETVASGYAGGQTDNPTYQEVCAGTTGHAEVIQLGYDPDVVSYEKLLEVFWKSHDPTTPNQQGNDIGTQYRSIIFYHDENQKALAEEYKAKLDAAGVFENPIVTQIEAFTRWYPAEDYHQDYFKANPNQGYCRAMIAPKVAKIREIFSDDLKPAD